MVIGFDDNIFSLLHELIEANANKKSAVIVVLGEQPKEEMEDAIHAHLPNTNTVRIICRSGKLYENYSLQRCAVEDSKSVIVNVHDDAETVKILLALSAYIKGKKLFNSDLRFVASLEDDQYVEAANIASEGRGKIIFTKDAIARIIANTCRQHGLSQVLTELFNFGGNELYIESVPEIVGKTFAEAQLCFSNAVLVGICKKDTVMLNPPPNQLIAADDHVILLEEDDGAYRVHKTALVDTAAIVEHPVSKPQNDTNLLVLGSNDKLPIILTEYNRYVPAGTQVMIVDDDITQEKLPICNNLQINICTQPVTRELLHELLQNKATNILLLNDDSDTPENSDSQTLLKLILLRDIADNTNLRFSITTEMQNVDNQRLASQARVDDFVIGSNFASLLMAQISEEPKIMEVITDILDEEGSELYMKPIADYVQPDTPVNGYVLAESAARKREVFIGYRHVNDQRPDVVVNPNKEAPVTFAEKDLIIVIAEK